MLLPRRIVEGGVSVALLLRPRILYRLALEGLLAVIQLWCDHLIQSSRPKVMCMDVRKTDFHIQLFIKFLSHKLCT